MSTEKYHNCEEIIARVKIYLSVHTGKDLAKALGVSENAISTWKKRGTLDIGKILLNCEGINQEWLLTGKGGPAKSTANFGMEDEEMFKEKFLELSQKHISALEENIELRKKIADLDLEKKERAARKVNGK